MTIIHPAPASGEVPAVTKLRDQITVHGDGFAPRGGVFLCKECDVYWPAVHFFTALPYSQSRHKSADHLEHYLYGLSRRLPRKHDTHLNFFTALVFNGREPSREVARTLRRLILRKGPINTKNLKTLDLVDAAVAVEHYRRAMGDL